MTSDFKQSSPSSGMLNIAPMGATPGFGGGSHTGSEFEFGTPSSLTIDTMMAGSDMGRPGPMADFRSAPAGISGYANAFDQPSVAQSMQHPQHRGSMSSLPDGQSPGLGQHHRLSFSSNGPYANQDRTNSIGSDTASQIGENAYASNSNDTVNSQAVGDDANGKNGDGSANPPPPWSELKTKAGKERKRLPLACIACRRKKIRCSGEKPACKHCLRSRIPCVYKVTTRKAAPRTDYMAMLDKRLKRMEERVIKVIPKEEQGVVTATGRAVVKPPLPPAPPKSAGSTKKRGAEAAFGDDLDDWANANPAAAGAKSLMDHDMEKEPLKIKDPEAQNLLQDGADKLPAKAIQEHLAEVFFDYVYGQSYPLLHKPSFMRRLAQGTIPPVLILAVCAMSARFSNHPEVKTEPAFLRGENWASAARDIALRRYDQPNITILIVYLILGLHEFGTCQGGRSWMFGGMAQRMAYALQLHHDLDHEPKRDTNERSELTFTDREIRRRTMWSCFLMDRFNSSGTERPIFVGEHYIKAQLPIRDKYYQMEVTGPTEDLEGNVPNPVEPGTGQMSDAKENMGVSAWLIRLVNIWGRLINYNNLGGKDRDTHPMWSHDSDFFNIKTSIEQWREKLPKTLCYTDENLHNYSSEGIANQFIFLHIVYYQIVLFMNRFALPTPGTRPNLPKDMPPEFSSEACRAARDAANQISTLVHEGMDHRMVAPFAGYSAFLSSTVHVNGAFSGNKALEASSKNYLAWNVKYLTKMKKHWGMFHFVTENLRDLYRRHADAARSGKAGGKEGDQAVFQYGDWFDRYPHGVSGTDYEEPSTNVKREPGADAVLGQKSDLQSVEEFFSKMSPPSRAANNQASQPQQKKAPKKRSKHENKQSTASNTSQQTQDMKSADQAQHTSHPHTDDLLGTHDFQDTLNFPQHSAAFPPGYQGPPNALLMPPPQQFMSQLDRQMVLNSYAGAGAVSGAQHQLQTDGTHHNNNNNSAHPGLLDGGQSLDQFDFNAFAPSNGGGGWGSDPSAAWFMPFNMEPPAVGEDNNLFSGGIDWANFGGFGDLGAHGLPPTGLTPRPEFDVDTGQDGMSGDGMDGTQ